MNIHIPHSSNPVDMSTKNYNIGVALPTDNSLPVSTTKTDNFVVRTDCEATTHAKSANKAKDIDVEDKEGKEVKEEKKGKKKSGFFSKIGKGIKGFAKGVIKAGESVAKAAVEVTKGTFKAVKGTFDIGKGVVTGDFDKVKSGFGTVGKSIQENARATATGVEGGMNGLCGGTGSLYTNTAGAIFGEKAEKVTQTTHNVGSNFAKGMVTGTANGAADVVEMKSAEKVALGALDVGLSVTGLKGVKGGAKAGAELVKAGKLGVTGGKSAAKASLQASDDVIKNSKKSFMDKLKPPTASFGAEVTGGVTASKFTSKILTPVATSSIQKNDYEGSGTRKLEGFKDKLDGFKEKATNVVDKK